MSADNYTACPRCWERHRAVVKEARAAADAAYGQATKEEYNRLVGSADRLAGKAAFPKDTLAEYEESTLSLQGEFSYTYSCRCSECGLAWSTEYAAKMPYGEDPAPKPVRHTRRRMESQ